MGENATALKDMAAQLADMLRIPGAPGKEAWSQLHNKLAEVAAAANSNNPRTAVQALMKLAKDASSSESLMRSLDECVSNANPYVLKHLVLLVAHKLNLTPLGDSEPVYMVYGDKKFSEDNVDGIIKSSAELSAHDASYAVISIVGAQSSGKSYLLNRLFGTKFPEMDAKRGRSQTTRGIMLSRCIWPSLLLLDVEGFDGIENEKDTSFENKAALFALVVSDLMIINMFLVDTGRVHGGSTPLFKTIFQERTKIERAGLTKILVVVRDYDGETPFRTVKHDVLQHMEKTWKSVNGESMKLKDYIEADVFGISNYKTVEFPKEVTVLRRLLSENRSSKVQASGFMESSKTFWKNIQENRKLDIPSHQVLIATLYCQRLVEETLTSLDSLEDYMLLKAEQSPSCFKKRSDALLERIGTKYDLETKMYDSEIKGKERKSMVEKLNQNFADYARNIIRRMQENSSEQFEGEFDSNIQNKNTVDAISAGEQIKRACLDKFMSSCADLKDFDSDYLETIYRQLKDHMKSHATIGILKIEVEHERKARENAETSGLIAVEHERKARENAETSGLIAVTASSANIGYKIGNWLGQHFGP